VITRQQVEEFFEHTRGLRRAGETDWDIDGPCLWSYFFVDRSEAKLIRAGESLEKQGYRIAGLFAPHPDDPEKTLRLQVDRIETHSVESLVARNDDLYAVARQYKLEDYDGMECGAVEDP